MEKNEFLIDDILYVVKIGFIFLLASTILAWLLTEIDQYVDRGAALIPQTKVFLLNILFSFIVVSIFVKKIDNMTSFPRRLKPKFLYHFKYESYFYIALNSFVMSCAFYFIKYYMVTFSGLTYSSKEMTVIYDFMAILLIPLSLFIFVMYVVWRLKHSR